MPHLPRIFGSIPALLTPMRGGALDEEAFARFVEWQIAQGSHALVSAGTTGESPTLTHAEHDRVNALCVEVVAGRIPVIAGTGSNSTAEAISMTQHAQEVGADAALVVVPYYNKPTPAGLLAHFTAVHDATDIPIILYNVPGRSVVDMGNELVAALAELPRVVGIKDATGDLQRPADLVKRMEGGQDPFLQISGEDDTVLEFLAAGGVGCISVTANVAPKLCAEMHNAWNAGDETTARAIQARLMPLHHIMFCESSPGPAKYAASLLGLMEEELRLPLVPPTEAHQAEIRTVMEQLELL